MQLSVTTPPADPSLAAVLLGGLAPANANSAAASPTVDAGAFADILAQSGPLPSGEVVVPLPANAAAEVPSEAIAAQLAPAVWQFAPPVPSEPVTVGLPEAAGEGSAETGVTLFETSAVAPPSGHAASPSVVQVPALSHVEGNAAQAATAGEMSGTVLREAPAKPVNAEHTPRLERGVTRKAARADGMAMQSTTPASPPAMPVAQQATPVVAQEVVAGQAVNSVVTTTAATLPSIERAQAGEVPVDAPRSPVASTEVLTSSVPTDANARPFGRDLPPRQLTDWPLTAQPESQAGPAAAVPSPIQRGNLPMVDALTTAVDPRALPADANAKPVSHPASVPSLAPETLPVAMPRGTELRMPVVQAMPGSGSQPLAKPETMPAAEAIVARAVPAAVADAPATFVTPNAANPALPIARPTPPAGVAVRPEIAGANFAVSQGAPRSRGNLPIQADAKIFVPTVAQRLTTAPEMLGTGVANSVDAMFTAPPLLNPTAGHEGVTWTVGPGQEVASNTAPSTPAAPETMSTAHRAVEAVLTAVHRFTSREQHAVSLQFSVAGADLNVRVEMRGDEVRATFATDSAELRAALAHEWQATSANVPAGERPVRLANPVFTSSDGSPFNGAADQQSSRHRHANTNEAPEPFTLAGLRTRAARAAAFEASVPVISPVITRAPLSTALHLHTLA